MTEPPANIHAEQRQAERRSLLTQRTMSGSELFAASLEVVTGMIALREAGGDQGLEDALDGVFTDLQRADRLEIATTFAHHVIRVLEALQVATNIPVAELWQGRIQSAAAHTEGDTNG